MDKKTIATKIAIFQIVTPLSMDTAGGKQELNCANTEGIFRIIQSIPSPKAEPFKRWLARVGYERVKEIEDPELVTKRTRMLYTLNYEIAFLCHFEMTKWCFVIQSI